MNDDDVVVDVEGENEGQSVVWGMVIMKERVWSLWRGHPLEPHHQPPPLPCSKSGIGVE